MNELRLPAWHHRFSLERPALDGLSGLLAKLATVPRHLARWVNTDSWTLQQRVRMLFWLLAVAGALLAVPEMDAGRRGLGVAAVAVQVAWWSWRLHRGWFPVWGLPAEAALLLAADFALSMPARPTLLVYGGLCFRSLFGTPLAVTGVVAAYLVAHLGQPWLRGTVPGLGDGLLTAAGFVLCAFIIENLGRRVVQRDEGQLRERVLTYAASQLANAADLGDVYQSCLLAVRALGARHGWPRVSLLAGGAEMLELVAASDRPLAGAIGDSRSAEDWPQPIAEAARALTAACRTDASGLTGPCSYAHPLARRGRLRGVVVVETENPLSVAARDGLCLVGSEVVLALARIDLVAELRHQEAQFRALVQNSSDLIVLVDAHGAVRYVSPAVTRILGWRPAEIVGRPLAAALDDAQSGVADRQWAEGLVARSPAPATAELSRHVCRVRSRGGGWRHVEVVVNDLRADPEVAGIVLNARDVTQRVLLEDQLRRRAHHDPLTDLANRSLFAERLDAALARSADTGGSVAVLMVDLDDFKSLNDSRGHAAGDRLLQAVAGRLRGCLRAGDLAARFGGDEFVALLEEADEGTAATLAARVLGALAMPIEIEGSRVRVQASVGVAATVDGADDASELLSRADAAMYEAKRSGKGHFRIKGAARASRSVLEGRFG